MNGGCEKTAFLPVRENCIFFLPVPTTRSVTFSCVRFLGVNREGECGCEGCRGVSVRGEGVKSEGGEFTRTQP